MTGKERRELIDELTDSMEEPVYLADGFDEAIIGMDYIGNRVVYSYSKMIETMMTRDGMTEEEAAEYIDYNFYGFSEDKVVICDDSAFSEEN